MTEYSYQLIDNNTGEEVFPSDGFRFLSVPNPDHRIHDPVLREHFGGPAVVDRVEESPDGPGRFLVRVYIDAVEERMNDDDIDSDQAYRRS